MQSFENMPKPFLGEPLRPSIAFSYIISVYPAICIPSVYDTPHIYGAFSQQGFQNLSTMKSISGIWRSFCLGKSITWEEPGDFETQAGPIESQDNLPSRETRTVVKESRLLSECSRPSNILLSFHNHSWENLWRQQTNRHIT